MEARLRPQLGHGIGAARAGLPRAHQLVGGAQRDREEKTEQHAARMLRAAPAAGLTYPDFCTTSA